jgi:hypothetical protein
MRRVHLLIVTVAVFGAATADAHVPQNVAAAWDGTAACLAPASLTDAEIDAALGATCNGAACPKARTTDSRVERQLRLIRMRYGYDASVDAKREAEPWQPHLVDSVIAALADLGAPPQPRIRTLMVDARIDRFRGDLAITDSSAVLLALSSPHARVGIRLGATWAGLPGDYRRAAMFHELIHDLVRSRGDREKWQRAWLRAADADAYFAELRRAGGAHVSLYARQNMEEDVAESATAYRYMPERLKARSPNRYRVLRDWLFGGREYLPGAPCA